MDRQPGTKRSARCIPTVRSRVVENALRALLLEPIFRTETLAEAQLRVSAENGAAKMRLVV